MAKVLSAPGKTFLIGEYLALAGGPSLLVSTQPRFQLTALTREDRAGTVAHPFAPQSPAGKLVARYPRDYGDYHFEFADPHAGAGGLGASSAQWALVYILKYGLPKEDQEIASMLEEYRQCAWNGEGFAPSGADVVSQVTGGVTCFDGREFKTERLEWLFPKLSFTLVRTGVKLATHEHLRKQQAPPQDLLRAQVTSAIAAFRAGHEEPFVRAVQDFAATLSESGRTAVTTEALLEKLKSQSFARAAKGCGAMGADVVLILHDSAQTEAVKRWALGENLVLCGGLAAPDLGLDLGARFES